MGLERIVGSNACIEADTTTIIANQAEVDHDIRHVPKYGGENWFVSKNGLDTNSGERPDDSFLTIGAALAAASAGDSITVRAGAYAEDVNLTLAGLELHGEIGTVIMSLTVTAITCLVEGIIVDVTAAVGVTVIGNYTHLNDVRVGGTPTIAFDLDCTFSELRNCNAVSYTVTGFDISDDGNILEDCFAIAMGTARGYYLSYASADGNLLRNCVSTANATAGFETVADANYNVFDNCSSGFGDGERIDAGQFNTWPRFVDHGRREEHEDTYPYFAGEGVANLPVTVNNTVTDDSGAGPWTDQDYWGDVVRIIAPSMLIRPWYSIGMYVYAVTANKILPWQIIFTNPYYVATRSAGNAWDYQETVLTVSDPTLFEVSDKVWITGDGHPAGEICDVADVTGDVVTITSETRFSADTGLKYNYTGNEQMFVVRRSFTPLLDGYMGDFSAGSAKDFARIDWVKPKLLNANSAMLMRMADSTDDLTSSFEVRAIYED